MSPTYTVLLFALLVFLILLSGFFSMAETALMALNRYRLRHKARTKKPSAMLILNLLKRPDRLLGMVLIGNCFANIIASALATVLAVHFFGNEGVVISTFFLAFFVLIFAEVAPKTVAALYADRVSQLFAWPVFILLKLFYPLVWLANVISNNLLRLFGIKIITNSTEAISREELRSIVYETSGRMPSSYQNMMLGILDLNKMTVNDVMVPKHEVVGINLKLEWKDIQNQVIHSSHDWLPLYHDTINQVVGMLHARELLSVVATHNFNRETLLKLIYEPYFIPENTPLNIQLLNFQQKHKRIALVVDEYGEVQGLITLSDILEEIVGEFVTSVAGNNKVIQAQSDGSFLVDGAITIRELNRVTKWKLPTKGPRTLNGLLIEYLEALPRAGTGVKINDYPIEIIQVQKNRVKVARIFPRLT